MTLQMSRDLGLRHRKDENLQLHSLPPIHV